jgi:hypothetical protein
MMGMLLPLGIEKGDALVKQIKLYLLAGLG